MEHKDFYNTQSDLLNIIAILSSNDLIDYYMDLEEPEIIPKGARKQWGIDQAIGLEIYREEYYHPKFDLQKYKKMITEIEQTLRKYNFME